MITKEGIAELYAQIDDPSNGVKTKEQERFHSWLRLSFNPEDKNMSPKWLKACFVVRANQGWEFKGWGTQIADLKGHQVGLAQDDALSLLFFTGIFTGMAVVSNIDPYKELEKYYTWYVEYFEEESKPKIEIVK